MEERLRVLDGGRELSFTFADLLRFHGGGSPGGVAMAFKVLERALALLGPAERRAITIRTAFGGPGARDGFELVTRAVTDDRYVVDPALARPELGRERERFVFVVAHGDAEVTLVLRDGLVTGEFIDLARTDPRSEEQEARLDALKADLAERVMALPADAVYDVVTSPG